MYAKLFSRITESSLMEEEVPTRYVFMMLLAISDPKGYVIGTDVAIARRVNLSVPDLQKAIKALMSPDEHSNSKEHEGRRIIPSDGERGYYLVNYMTYRNLLDEDGRRAYMREYMRERRLKEKGLGESVSDVNVNAKQPLAPLTQEEGEAKAEEKGKEYSLEFESFWTDYPKKVGKGKAWSAWQKAKGKPVIGRMLAILDRQKDSPDWLKEDGRFTPHPSTWLNERRWEDGESLSLQSTPQKLTPEQLRALDEAEAAELAPMMQRLRDGAKNQED